MLNSFDLVNATLRYIMGACLEWEQHAKQFIGRPEDFHQFCLRTHDVCWKYARGQKTLNGSCSDFECTTAMEMRRAFRDNFDYINKEN